MCGKYIVYRGRRIRVLHHLAELNSVSHKVRVLHQNNTGAAFRTVTTGEALVACTSSTFEWYCSRVQTHVSFSWPRGAEGLGTAGTAMPFPPCRPPFPRLPKKHGHVVHARSLVSKLIPQAISNIGWILLFIEGYDGHVNP